MSYRISKALLNCQRDGFKNCQHQLARIRSNNGSRSITEQPISDNAIINIYPEHEAFHTRYLIKTVRHYREYRDNELIKAGAKRFNRLQRSNYHQPEGREKRKLLSRISFTDRKQGSNEAKDYLPRGSNGILIIDRPFFLVSMHIGRGGWRNERMVATTREKERVSPLLTCQTKTRSVIAFDSYSPSTPLFLTSNFFFFSPFVFHSPGCTLIYAVTRGNTKDRESSISSKRERESHNVSHNMSRRELSFPRDETPATASIWYLKARRTVHCTRIM